MSTRPELPFSFTHYVRDNCLCLHVQRAARAVARRFDEALRPVGLTQGQFALLMSLNRPAPPTMGNVAAVLVLDRTTLTAKLKPLRRRGLVRVKVDANDKRSRRLVLTAAGRAVLVAATPSWKRAQAQTERLLRNASADNVRKSLRELC